MTTTPDFRALCAELLEVIEGEYDGTDVCYELRHRADTALATSPPEPPTDDELLKAVRHLYGDQSSADMGADDDLLTARALLERWGK